jgi:hypothetical protein
MDCLLDGEVYARTTAVQRNPTQDIDTQENNVVVRLLGVAANSIGHGGFCYIRGTLIRLKANP